MTATPSEVSTTSPVDGRSARRARNRATVLDATHELFTESRTIPSVETIAERSGVSERSIHRYFPTTQDLVLEAMAHRMSANEHLYELESPGEGTLAERIDQIVEQRLSIHEHASATIRVALAVVDSMPLIAERVTLREEQVRAQLHLHFAPELTVMKSDQAIAVMTSVEMLTHFVSVDRMVTHLSMSPEAVRHSLRVSLTALLTAADRVPESRRPGGVAVKAPLS